MFTQSAMMWTLGATMSNMSASVGAVSSTVFIVQIVVQIKLYGFRTWLHWGVGTGVRPDEAKKEEREAKKLYHEGRECVDRCLHDIEDWL